MRERYSVREGSAELVRREVAKESKAGKRTVWGRGRDN